MAVLAEKKILRAVKFFVSDEAQTMKFFF